MIIALVAPVFAQDDPAEEFAAPDTGGCAMATVSHSVPSPNATDVPRDVHPSLVFEGECGALSFDIAVVDPVTGVTLATMRWEMPDVVPAVATLTPTSLLPADTDLALTATSADGWGEVARILFRTSAASAEPLSGVLAAAVIDATFWENDSRVTASLDITPIPDPSGMSLVRVEGPQGAGWYDADLLAEPVVIGFPSAEPPDEVCFDVFQLDGAGVEAGPAPACRSFQEEKGCGCQSTDGAGLLGLLGVLALAFRRR